MSSRHDDSRRGSGRSQQQQQVEIYGRDPFQQMHQMMMRNFGGIGLNDDFFGGSLMRPMQDPFEEIMKFSDAHKGLHKANKQGSYVCQTFVSSSKMGPDGNMHTESYYENNAGQHQNGQTISQKQQAYKNNQGVNRIAEERMLNDRGRKIVKDKRGGQIEETNHYYNMDEEDVQNFDHHWQSTNQDLRFLENAQKAVSRQPEVYRLENSQQRNSNRNSRQPELRQPESRGYPRLPASSKKY